MRLLSPIGHDTFWGSMQSEENTIDRESSRATEKALEKAFEPYSQFVQTMALGLKQIESAFDFQQAQVLDLSSLKDENLRLRRELEVQIKLNADFENQSHEAPADLSEIKRRLDQEKARTSAAVSTGGSGSKKQSQSAPSFDSDPVALSEKSVLLVDDAEINRVLMSHYFKGLPVKLDFAVNAELANTKCRECTFDLVVIDFDENGRALAQNLKNQGLKAILIAMSSNAFSETEKEAALSTGFDHYVSRGLRREELVSDIRSKLWK